MTFIFNSSKYSELLSQYQPKLIRTEADKERALAIVEELMHRSSRSPEESELYDLLIVLIEKFEQELSPHLPIPQDEETSKFLPDRSITPYNHQSGGIADET